MRIYLIIFLLFLSESKIPIQYKELADRALQNAKRKVARELRDETQYPGIYEGNDYHFLLRKTFTSANTNDIKGFASNGNNFAIVKRKKFNIKDDYIFIDSDTQTLYHLKKTIASEDNIIIYESSVTDIFSLFTNFHIHSSTDNEIPFNYSYHGTKIPRAGIEKNFNWDTNSNKPILKTITGTSIKYGYGAYAKLGLNTDFSFNSIFDVKLSLSINLFASIGGEVVIPSNTQIPIPDKLLLNLNYPIPSMAISKKFLGLSIKLGAFFNFAVNLTDMEVNIPIGFDYFKGYQLTGSKYYQITPNSVSDSKWNIQFVGLPESSSIANVKNSLLSSSFIGTFNVIPSFIFMFGIGSFNISFELGLLIQFKYNLNFNTQRCMFPYLGATINIPISMFYSFSGIKISRWNIIKAKSNIISIRSFKLGPFCINAPSCYIEGNKKFIQTKEDESQPYLIDNTDFYEQRASGQPQVQKQIRFSIKNSKNEAIEQHPFPYSTYETSPSSNTISFVSSDIQKTDILEWRIYYKNSQNEEKQAGYLGRIYGTNISNYQYSQKFGIPIDES